MPRLLSFGFIRVFLAVGLLCAPPAISTAAEAPGVVCLTADDHLAYAQALYDAKEFLEAAAEFKRFLRFFPGDSRIESAEYHVGICFFQAGQFTRAIQSFQSLVENFGETPLGVKAHLGISESYLKLDNLGQALIALFNLIALTEDPAVKDEAYYRAGWIYLEAAQWDKSRTAFNNISPSGREAFAVAPLLVQMETHRQLRRKDPALAGLFAVVPGAGYLYCQRYRDALTALVVNGLFAWAAFEAFDNESPALGSLLSLAGVGFYSGSLFGSVSSARKFNQNQDRKLIEKLKNKKRVDFTVSLKAGGGMLAARFPF